jgi:hypothetical protein
MLLVVTQPAVEGDPSADRRWRKRISGNNLRSSQRAAGVHQAHTPSSAAATPHPEDPTDNSGLHAAKAPVALQDGGQNEQRANKVCKKLSCTLTQRGQPNKNIAIRPDH